MSGSYTAVLARLERAELSGSGVRLSRVEVANLQQLLGLFDTLANQAEILDRIEAEDGF